MKKQKILILGVGGMVGHKLFVELSKDLVYDVYGTSRKMGNLQKFFNPELTTKIIVGVEATKFETIESTLEKLKPDVVINCIGITKQLIDEDNPLLAIEINSALPHKIAEVCLSIRARMIQITTDCVFNGLKGDYQEIDPSDATDIYGRTKFLGEVYYPHCLTIRTSFIGHEIGAQKHGLLEWFLSQEGQAKGFTRAIYSGMPTVEIARVIREYILPNEKLSGLYHVSSDPINKFDLLHLIAMAYHKKIDIIPDNSVAIDRSLDSDRFRVVTGYRPLPWEEMVSIMHEDCESYGQYK